jgi:hypothetical protein
MIPQERGLEGIKFYFLFLIALLSKGVDQLRDLLSEVQEVLDSPRKYLNPSLV